jgi:hypothetical protein
MMMRREHLILVAHRRLHPLLETTCFDQCAFLAGERKTIVKDSRVKGKNKQNRSTADRFAVDKVMYPKDELLNAYYFDHHTGVMYNAIFDHL